MLSCMIEKIAIIMFPSKYATAKAFTTVLFSCLTEQLLVFHILLALLSKCIV